MADISIFGKQTPSTFASSILDSPSLNALPSPEVPKSIPKDNTAKHYAHVLYSLYQLRQTETDPIALHQVEEFIRFADEQYSKLALNDDELSGLIPQTPQPAPMPLPPVAPPQAGPPGATPGLPPHPPM